MRERRELTLNAVENGISNGRVEGLNIKVRLLSGRAYGFHSPHATLALVMAAEGPITSPAPYPTNLGSEGRCIIHIFVRRTQLLLDGRRQGLA